MKLEDLRRIAARMRAETVPWDYAELQEYMRGLGLDPDQLYQELEMSARYAQAHQDTSDSDATVQLHSHSFYEILCCRNTCGAEYLVGTGRYRLQKGDIILVPPGISHRPLLPRHMPEPYVRDVIWVSEEFIRSITRLFPENAMPTQLKGSLLRTRGTKWEYLGRVIRNCVLEAEGGAPGWETVIMGHVLSLLTYLKRALADSATVPLPMEQSDLLDSVLGLVEEGLSDKLTVESVAGKLFVSESTVAHVFRQRMGISFYRYVTQRRLIYAKVLIMEGLPLETVAVKAGFSDYSGFYRAFKKEYGISPRDFRKLPGNSAAL